MKRIALPGLVVVGLLGLQGCTPTYTLVSRGAVPVAGKSYVVSPSSGWNKLPKAYSEIPLQENWTRNGSLLDQVAFVGGLPDGKTLVVQKKKADKQVPAFRADMSPSDLVSMVESYYRITRSVEIFDINSVQPTPFLGASGIDLEFTYVGADGLPRKGSCVMAVLGKKLYLMKLDGAASHYFDAAAPEFRAMIASATLAH